MTGTSEETPVVAPKKEEVVKLSNSFKEACVLTKSELVTDKENFYLCAHLLMGFDVHVIKDYQP